MADQAEERIEEEQEESSVGGDLREVIDKLEAVTDEDHEEHAAEEQAAAPEKTKEEVPAEAAEKESEPVSEPIKSAYKAPLDWGPKLKQEFGKLPESVQKVIHDRELSVNNVLRQTAQERRTAQEFNTIVSEFRGLMAAEGIQEPLQGIRGLLATTAQMAMGNQDMKAAKIAQLVRHYGVDIEKLDAALVGEQPQQQQPQPIADPRLDYVFNRMQQAEENAQLNMVQKADSTIHEFGADAKNEFFEDVRASMADFLDVAAKHGQEMSLREAYDRACAINPEISQIIAERNAQHRGQTSAEHAAQKANAASSISGRSGGMTGGADVEGGSIRDILESQFSQTGRV
jgi:hypothetical protein